MIRTLTIVLSLLLLSTIALCGEESSKDSYPATREPIRPPTLPQAIKPDKYLTAAAHFADAWLSYGIDTYGKESTPLFSDLIDKETLAAPMTGPAYSQDDKNKDTILCEYAGQQNFLRVLDSLTTLTGVQKYKAAAEKSVRYMFQRYWDEKAGLLQWGEHNVIDLYCGNTFGLKGTSHEVKGSFPYYELLYRVEPEKTAQLVQGMWQAHVQHWDYLSYTRHGRYGKSHTLDGTIWKRPWKDPGTDHYDGGLPFLICGIDLITAAMKISHLDNDPLPALWGERMLYQAVRQRDPKTKILPTLHYRPRKDRSGDRAFIPFGSRYSHILENRTYFRGYHFDVSNGMMGLLEAYASISQDETLFSGKARAHLAAIRDHLVGYFRYAYNPSTHKLKVIINDGTDLTGYEISKDSYWVQKGPVTEIGFGNTLYPAYAAAIRLFPEDKELWHALRTFFKGGGMGDMGSFESKKPQFNMKAENDDPEVVVALVDLYEKTGNKAYLVFAEHIAENIYKQRFDETTGLFSRGKDYLFAQIDAFEPQAFLLLWAAKNGRLDEIPRFNGGGRYMWNHKLMFAYYGDLFNALNFKDLDRIEETATFQTFVLGEWSKNVQALNRAFISPRYKEILKNRWEIE